MLATASGTFDRFENREKSGSPTLIWVKGSVQFSALCGSTLHNHSGYPFTHRGTHPLWDQCLSNGYFLFYTKGEAP